MRLSLPGGELASWLTSWTNVPGIVIAVVFLVLLFPDGRMPSRRWWPLGLVLGHPVPSGPPPRPVAVHVSSERVEDRPEEINQGIDRTLGNVKRLVEEPGGADA